MLYFLIASILLNAILIWRIWEMHEQFTKAMQEAHDHPQARDLDKFRNP